MNCSDNPVGDQLIVYGDCRNKKLNEYCREIKCAEEHEFEGTLIFPRCELSDNMVKVEWHNIPKCKESLLTICDLSYEY